MGTNVDTHKRQKGAAPGPFMAPHLTMTNPWEPSQKFLTKTDQLWLVRDQWKGNFHVLKKVSNKEKTLTCGKEAVLKG